MAIPYLGADGPRRGSDCGFHAARGRGDEIRGLWLSARSDGTFSTWVGSVDNRPVQSGRFCIPAAPIADSECSMAVAPGWVWVVARGICRPFGHRDCLWSDGRPGSEGLQICHRLLKREPYGICAARVDDAASNWIERSGAANVLARCHRGTVIRRGWPDGL